jgi:hypothetical protein
MKDFAKIIAFFATQAATGLMALLLVASLFVQQAEGCFWYGLGLIVSGVALKLEIDYFWS